LLESFKFTNVTYVETLKMNMYFYRKGNTTNQDLYIEYMRFRIVVGMLLICFMNQIPCYLI